MWIQGPLLYRGCVGRIAPGRGRAAMPSTPGSTQCSTHHAAMPRALAVSRLLVLLLVAVALLRRPTAPLPHRRIAHAVAARPPWRAHCSAGAACVNARRGHESSAASPLPRSSNHPSKAAGTSACAWRHHAVAAGVGLLLRAQQRQTLRRVGWLLHVTCACSRKLWRRCCCRRCCRCRARSGRLRWCSRQDLCIRARARTWASQASLLSLPRSLGGT